MMNKLVPWRGEHMTSNQRHEEIHDEAAVHEAGDPR
jgi:hypothetical protein